MKIGDRVSVLFYGRARHCRGGWEPYRKTGVIVKINRKTVDVQIRPDWIERVKIERVEVI